MAPEIKSLRGKLIEYLGSMMVATADASGSTSGQMVPSSARRVADDVMSIVRAHDEEHAKAARPAAGITREQLATALDGLAVEVRSGSRGYISRLAYPDLVAADVMKSIAARRDPWAPAADPDDGAAPKWIEITRDELAALLAKLRVGIEQAEEWKMGPTAKLSRPETVADVIASHARGLRANEADDDAVDAPAAVQPGYYDGKTGMQPFDVIDEFGLDFYEGNVIKYLVRWRKKNGLEDLRKARTYLNRIITRAEATGE